MPISDDNIDLQKRACFEQILIYSILFSHVQQRLPEMEEPSIKRAILRLFLKQIVATYLSLQVGVLSDVLQFVQELVVPSRGPGVASGVPPGHGPGRRRDQPPRLRWSTGTSAAWSRSPASLLVRGGWGWFAAGGAAPSAMVRDFSSSLQPSVTGTE